MTDNTGSLPNTDNMSANVSKAKEMYRLILGREMDDPAVSSFERRLSHESVSIFELCVQLASSFEYLERLEDNAALIHPYLIHLARIKMVRMLLPEARRILDLGGANAPLYTIGYAKHFEEMILVDLPPTNRHAMYQDLQVDVENKIGRVRIHYGDMSDLSRYDDNSFDLVFSGESIEHIDADSGVRMCNEAFRVLRPGGSFCLDTPNRGVTEIHTADVGGGFIHPDHKREYYPVELKGILCSCGFSIRTERGICEMSLTKASKQFNYRDFVLGNQIVSNPDDGYMFYLEGLKPVSLG